MNSRKGQLLAWGSVVAGMVVLLVGAIAFRDRIAEEWYLHKLRSGDVEEQRIAVLKLGEIGSARVLPCIFEFLEDQDLHVTLGSGSPFGNGASTGDWPPMRLFTFIQIDEKSMSISDLDYNFTALSEISSRSGKGAVPHLAAALASWNVRVRTVAVVLLGVLGQNASEAVPALESIVNAKDDTLRSAVSEALKKIKGHEGTER